MNLHSGGKYNFKSIKSKSSRLHCCQVPNVALCARKQLTYIVDTSINYSSVVCIPNCWY